MTLPVWPPELPQRPFRPGFNKTPGDGRIHLEMDAGLPKVRRRTSAVVRPIQVAFVLTADQDARLDRFWAEDTAEGSLPFVIIDPTRHGQMLLTDDGNPILVAPEGVPLLIEAWWRVLFGKGGIQSEPFGGRWRAAFTLNVLPS